MEKQNFKIAKTTFASIVILALLIVGFSCSKKDVDQFTTIGFNYSYDVDVPAATITDSLKTEAEYLSPLIDSKSAEKIKDAKTTADLVSEIKMTKFTVTCIGGTSNLDYVKSIQVYIKSAKNSEVLLMEKTNIPAGATAVDMDLKDVNIKEFIFEDQIQFRTGITFKPTKAIDDQKMRLDATLLGKAKVPS